jgi:hypothetical protein
VSFGLPLPGERAKPMSFGKEETEMNKILLAAIAIGLWANAASTFIRPAHAYGCDCADELSNKRNELVNVESAVGDVERAIKISDVSAWGGSRPIAKRQA